MKEQTLESCILDKIAIAATELAECASYTEIIGEIRTNRKQIRISCDEIFELIRSLENLREENVKL